MILRSIFKEVQKFTLYENSKVPHEFHHISQKILFMISFQNLVNILLLQNVFFVNIHRYEKILRQKLLSKHLFFQNDMMLGILQEEERSFADGEKFYVKLEERDISCTSFSKALFSIYYISLYF
ncbi:hypothetical protein Avbf_08605 [Armadillidium vulgare]|nr:hypothetical protein Avbf_08605 [Armadillidium vulgare]